MTPIRILESLIFFQNKAGFPWRPEADLKGGGAVPSTRNPERKCQYSRKSRFPESILLGDETWSDVKKMLATTENQFWINDRSLERCLKKWQPLFVKSCSKDRSLERSSTFLTTAKKSGVLWIEDWKLKIPGESCTESSIHGSHWGEWF